MGAVLAGTAIVEGIEALTAGEILGGAVSGIGALAGGGELAAGAGEAVAGALEGITSGELAGGIAEGIGIGGEDIAIEEAVLTPFEEEGYIAGLEDEFGEFVGPQASDELFDSFIKELEIEVGDITENIGLTQAESSSLSNLVSKIKDNITLELFKKVLQRIGIGAISYAAGKELLNEIVGDTDSIFVIDENGNLKQNKLSASQLASKMMQVVNLVINKSTLHNLTDEDSIIQEVESKFSNLNFADKLLSKKMWGFIKNSPIFKSGHLDLFNEIYSKYNGKGIKIWKQFNVTTGRDNYFLQDEQGDVEVYYKPPNPNSVSTFYGVYGGPNSYNNALPIDLLDTFYCSHDISYQDAFFNLHGDLKLISRILHNIDQFDFKTRAIALATVQYFSSAGITIASMTGKTSPINAGDLSNIKDDIYDQFNKPQISKNSIVASRQVLAESRGKEEFYTELSTEYMQNFLDYQLNQGIAYDDQELENNIEYNNGILKFFDNIELTL